MSKQLYTRSLPLLVALLLAIAAPVFAGGSQEAVGDAAEPEPAATRTAALSGADSLETAIEMAMVVPDEWDYDPGSRVIYGGIGDVEFPLGLDDSVWLSRLESFEYYVLREQGTEYAFSDPMHASKQKGIYYSRATGQPLFSSEDKYDSGTGWPSFTRPINPDAIVYILDTMLFGPRIEVVDSLSGSHLGHVFPDGPAPTGQRYCINAASLIFVPEGEKPPAIIAELQELAARK